MRPAAAQRIAACEESDGPAVRPELARRALERLDVDLLHFEHRPMARCTFCMSDRSEASEARPGDCHGSPNLSLSHRGPLLRLRKAFPIGSTSVCVSQYTTKEERLAEAEVRSPVEATNL